MPYMLPPGLGYAHPATLEARRLDMLKTTAREADSWMAAYNAEQGRLARLAEQQRQQQQQEMEAVLQQQARADIGVSENERIARMSLNRIWEQPTPIAPAPYGYTNVYDITPPGPNMVQQQQQQQLPQAIPVMRPSYMIDSPYYHCDPAYVHPGYPAPRMPEPAPMAFNPFDPADFDPAAFHAPAMHPRAIQQDIPAFTAYQPVVAPAAVPRNIQNLTLNEALSTWYAEQVLTALVKPGMFRSGVNGQSDEIWGPAGREHDSWTRIGQIKLGSPTARKSNHHSRRTSLNRDPACEAYDPWEVMWKNRTTVSERLVNFIHELVQRMSIGPTAVVAAVWYLHGLGLHEGDGDKGRRIRMLLRKMYASDDEAVERRVATLGLLLAGKWLDDNSFLTKSWTEVTHIPVEEVDKLERAALADLYFSLHVPLSSWADHVNMRWTELLTSPERTDDAYDVLLPIIDKMVAEARATETETRKPVDPAEVGTPYYDSIDERLEEAYYAATAAEAAAEAEASAAEAQKRRYVSSNPSSTPVSQWFSPHAGTGKESYADADVDADDEMQTAARNVSALVDEDMGDAEEISEVDGAEEHEEDSVVDSDDESDDEFLDYDGATRFLPTMSELRRSASNSSAQSELVEQWRQTLPQAGDNLFAFAPPSDASPRLFPPRSPLPELPADHVWAEDRPAHSRVTSSALRGEPIDPRLLPVRHRPVHPVVPFAKPIQRSTYKETGVFLEPGIAQVRPPTGSSAYHRQPLNPLPQASNYSHLPSHFQAQSQGQAQDNKGFSSSSRHSASDHLYHHLPSQHHHHHHHYLQYQPVLSPIDQYRPAVNCGQY